ncbi:MAG: transporter [Gemmatimonadaceae bacterium]
MKEWVASSSRGEAFAILVTVCLCAVSVCGDYFLKRASERVSPFVSWSFWMGFLLYSSTAFGWVFVMRRMHFASLGVVYSLSTILLLAAVGAVFLGEPIRRQEVLGILLAIVAIGLLTRLNT